MTAMIILDSIIFLDKMENECERWYIQVCTNRGQRRIQQLGFMKLNVWVLRCINSLLYECVHL